MVDPTQRHDAQNLFSANMRRIRKEKGLTQEKVAEGAGLHPNYISSVERGERNVSIRSIHRIAGALGVTMSELVAEPVGVAKPSVSNEPVSPPTPQSDSVQQAPSEEPPRTAQP